MGCHALLQDLPNPGIQPRSPALQADSLPSEPYVTVPQSARASQRALGEGRDPRIRHLTQKIQDHGSITANSPHIDKWHMGQFLTGRSVRNQWLGVVCVSQCGSCWRRNWGIHSTGNKVCVLVVPSIFLFPRVAPAEQGSKHNSHTNSHSPTPILNLQSPKDEKTRFHRLSFRNFFSSHNCHSYLA